MELFTIGYWGWKSRETTLSGFSTNSCSYSKASFQNLTTPSSPPVAKILPSGLYNPSF